MKASRVWRVFESELDIAKKHNLQHLSMRNKRVRCVNLAQSFALKALISRNFAGIFAQIQDKNAMPASVQLLCRTVALFYAARPIGKCFSLLGTQTFACLQTGGGVSPCGNRCLAKSVWPTQPTSVRSVVWNWTCWQEDEEKNNSPHLAVGCVRLFILQSSCWVK